MASEAVARTAFDQALEDRALLEATENYALARGAPAVPNTAPHGYASAGGSEPSRIWNAGEPLNASAGEDRASRRYPTVSSSD